MEVRHQQLQLRRMAEGRLVALLPASFLALALVACGIGWWFATPPGWIVGAFVGVVAIAASQAVPHIVRAGRALDSGRRTDVIVMVERCADSDSSAHIATVYAAPGTTWRLEFIPLGWSPKAGTTRVEGRFLSDAEWPVLLVFADGLAWPRVRPQRVENAVRAPRAHPAS